MPDVTDIRKPARTLNREGGHAALGPGEVTNNDIDLFDHEGPSPVNGSSSAAAATSQGGDRLRASPWDAADYVLSRQHARIRTTCSLTATPSLWRRCAYCCGVDIRRIALVRRREQQQLGSFLNRQGAPPAHLKTHWLGYAHRRCAWAFDNAGALGKLRLCRLRPAGLRATAYPHCAAVRRAQL